MRKRLFTWQTCVCLLCFVGLMGREARGSIFSDADVDSNFVALSDPCGGLGVYTEPHDDFPGAPGLHYLDIVGDANHAAGFRYSDGTHMFFRMRVDKSDAVLPQTVWQFLLDTDLDAAGYVNYALQLDNKVDHAVELIPASPGGPLFAQVNLSQNPNDGYWRGDPGIYSQIIVDTGDTDLGDTGPNDSFIDVAMPWADFTAQTGLDDTGFGSWRVYLTTSASHLQVTKDTPDCGEPVPEPSTLCAWGLLSGIGGIVALRHRRRQAS